MGGSGSLLGESVTMSVLLGSAECIPSYICRTGEQTQYASKAMAEMDSRGESVEP